MRAFCFFKIKGWVTNGHSFTLFLREIEQRVKFCFTQVMTTMQPATNSELPDYCIGVILLPFQGHK